MFNYQSLPTEIDVFTNAVIFRQYYRNYAVIMCIHEQKNWPTFTWNAGVTSTILGSVRHQQGKILGQMQSLGFRVQEETMLKALTMDVIISSEIEGELLNPEQVRSSIARRLGFEIEGAVPTERMSRVSLK